AVLRRAVLPRADLALVARPLAGGAELEAAEGGQLAELGAHIVGAIAGEHRAVVGRAVVLVLDEDDGEEGVLAQEAAVFVRVLEGPLHRLQVLLEAAAVDAELRHAGELLGESPAVVGLTLAGLGVDQAIDDEALAVVQRLTPGGHLEDAVVTVAAACRAAQALWPGADVGRDDAEVDVRQAALEALEHADELGEVVGQSLLLLIHRPGVVDDEEDVDVPVDGDRDLRLPLLGLVRVDRGHVAARTPGQDREGGRAERGKKNGTPTDQHRKEPPAGPCTARWKSNPLASPLNTVFQEVRSTQVPLPFARADN